MRSEENLGMGLLRAAADPLIMNGLWNTSGMEQKKDGPGNRPIL
jgi:hypothetical protein